MDSKRRAVFNAAHSSDQFARLMNRLENLVGSIPFRIAQSPLLLTHELRDGLVRQAQEIVAQLSDPLRMAHFRQAIPACYDVPGMDELPNTAQIDLALVQGASGALEGRLEDLQGFPSLYGLAPVMGETWAEVLGAIPSMDPLWSCFVGDDPAASLELIRRTLLGGNDPEEVLLVAHQPERQKALPDFLATQRLFGVDSECVTRLEVVGDKVFRRRGGHRLRVKRLYDRLAFDELEASRVELPFSWSQALDVSWCPHPNWSWVWSRSCLPQLSHPSVPRCFLLSDPTPPEDLSRLVLRPLFSRVRGQAAIDATPVALKAIRPEQRSSWMLQEKIEHAPAIALPDGSFAAAQVRVMFVRPPEEQAPVPVLLLARLARVETLGADFDDDSAWTVALWPVEG